MSIQASTDPTVEAVDPRAIARAVIDRSDYLTLATADAAGFPWATPAWFAERDLAAFYWVSRPDTQHSRNVAGRTEVALAVFDSTTPVGEATAVYVEASAGEVTGDDLAEGLEVYRAKSVDRGLPVWGEADVTGDAPHRLFRADVRRMWVLGDADDRIPVE